MAFAVAMLAAEPIMPAMPHIPRKLTECSAGDNDHFEAAREAGTGRLIISAAQRTGGDQRAESG
jgi:hypothetical protein